MSSMIGVMGQSGSGKTTSLRLLDPQTTFIIDADRKGLSWAGWKRDYVEGRNYLRESNPAKVKAALESINKKMPNIKTVVIDTVNSIMIDDEMRRMKEKGYDKWADLAQNVYELISDANVLRDDLVIVWTFHCEVCEDEVGGNRLVRFQTNGRKLQKINLEAKFPIVLFAQAKGDGEYIFQTQARQSVAKSPMGMFDTFEIKNDLRMVIDRVRAFEQDGGPLQSVGTDELVKDAVQPVSREEAFKKHEALFGKLIELQQRDAIVNFKLIEYLTSKGWFEGCKKLDDLGDEFLTAICQPENWEKVVAAIKPAMAQAQTSEPTKAEATRQAETAQKPAPVDQAASDVFDVVIHIRKAAQAAKVKEEELTKFLVDQGFIKNGQCWWEADQETFSMMSKPEIWNKIVLKITGQPF